MARFSISTSAIRRMVSAYNTRVRNREKEELIDSRGVYKGPITTFSLQKTEFNGKTRFCKIYIEEHTKYKTIEKYITINYLKTPIYSQYKSKKKVLVRTIKLTNDVLEELNFNKDPLIKQFSRYIIESLDNPDLIPSWFFKEIITEEKNAEVKSIAEKAKSDRLLYERNIAQKTSIITKCKEKNLLLKHTLDQLNTHLEKLHIRLVFAKNSKHKNVFGILTFGIIYYLKSNYMIKKLGDKIKEIEIKKANNIDQTNIVNSQINSCEADIKKIREEIAHLEFESKKKINDINTIYETQLREVKPLITDFYDIIDEDFIPLSKLAGLETQKVIGCYIIRNNELNKYYVGQSKDVFKRILKHHFKGTEINNVIFAQDYYSSKFENRDYIFSVKIIPCETKDELDMTEKRLIAEYDSFQNGYNKTSGNT